MTQRTNDTVTAKIFPNSYLTVTFLVANNDNDKPKLQYYHYYVLNLSKSDDLNNVKKEKYKKTEK